MPPDPIRCAAFVEKLTKPFAQKRVQKREIFQNFFECPSTLAEKLGQIVAHQRNRY